MVAVITIIKIMSITRTIIFLMIILTITIMTISITKVSLLHPRKKILSLCLREIPTLS